MKRSDSEIAAYAKGAGITGGNVAIAVAIALAESGGDDSAHNSIPPDDSYGLWQINMLGSMGPSRRAQFGITSNSALYDPAVNAHAMAIISSNGGNWRPWATYTAGKYRMFLARGETAAGSSAGTPVETAGLSDSFSGITALADLLTNPKTWFRVGIAIAGVIMLAIGLAKLTKVDNQIASGALKVGAKAVETAAVV